MQNIFGLISFNNCIHRYHYVWKLSTINNNLHSEKLLILLISTRPGKAYTAGMIQTIVKINKTLSTFPEISRNAWKLNIYFTKRKCSTQRHSIHFFLWDTTNQWKEFNYKPPNADVHDSKYPMYNNLYMLTVKSYKLSAWLKQINPIILRHKHSTFYKQVNSDRLKILILDPEVPIFQLPLQLKQLHKAKNRFPLLSTFSQQTNQFKPQQPESNIKPPRPNHNRKPSTDFTK